MSETLREMMAGLKSDFGNMHEDVKEIKQTINGNGGEGLKIKVDRNTQWRQSWRRHIATIIGFLLLIVAIVAIIVESWKE